MNKFDVAIIGAGPAGSAAAISLARRGYAVALIDKERFPREKLCGDFINPSNWPMLEQLGVTRQLFMQDHEIVTAFRITADCGAAAEAALPSIDGAPVLRSRAQALFLRSDSVEKSPGARRHGVDRVPDQNLAAPSGWLARRLWPRRIARRVKRAGIDRRGWAQFLGGAPPRHGQRCAARRRARRFSAAV